MASWPLPCGRRVARWRAEPLTSSKATAEASPPPGVGGPGTNSGGDAQNSAWALSSGAWAGRDRTKPVDRAAGGIDSRSSTPPAPGRRLPPARPGITHPAGGRRQAAGGRRQAAGGRRQAAGEMIEAAASCAVMVPPGPDACSQRRGPGRSSGHMGLRRRKHPEPPGTCGIRHGAAAPHKVRLQVFVRTEPGATPRVPVIVSDLRWYRGLTRPRRGR